MNETDEIIEIEAAEIIDSCLNGFPRLLNEFIASPTFPKVINSLITIFIFYLFYRVVKLLLKRIKTPRWTAQAQILSLKIVKYFFSLLCFLYILRIFGIQLTGLLGAAGIAGIAIGFAAQTSFSNIISGFFLLSEKTLKVGDFITVDDVVGTVDSIDLLSVKIHTVDNQMVRLPNETIIKSNLKNTSYNAIRRLSISVSVAYNSDLEQVRDVLLAVAPTIEGVLADPKPGVFFEEFGDSGIGVRLAVWLPTDRYWDVRNALFLAIKRTLDQNNIEIPFPQVVVHQ